MTRREQRTVATDSPNRGLATDRQRTNGQTAGQSNGQATDSNGQPSNGHDLRVLIPVVGPAECPRCRSDRLLVGPYYDRRALRCYQCGWTPGEIPAGKSSRQAVSNPQQTAISTVVDTSEGPPEKRGTAQKRHYSPAPSPAKAGHIPPQPEGGCLPWYPAGRTSPGRTPRRRPAKPTEQFAIHTQKWMVGGAMVTGPDGDHDQR
jgi:hypothetical protein